MFGFKRQKSPAPYLTTEELFNLWLDAVLENTRFTPDIAELERSPKQLVLIYNELKEKHRSHILLDNPSSTLDSICYTDQFFVLWKKCLRMASSAIAMECTGTWPQPSWNEPLRARIQGELYVVDSSYMTRLDSYHRNGIQFIRKKIKVVRPAYHQVRMRDHNTHKAKGLVYNMRICSVLDAWIYLGVEAYWKEQLGRMFKPTDLFTSERNPWLREYYAFTLPEYLK